MTKTNAFLASEVLGKITNFDNTIICNAFEICIPV